MDEAAQNIQVLGNGSLAKKDEKIVNDVKVLILKELFRKAASELLKEEDQKVLKRLGIMKKDE